MLLKSQKLNPAISQYRDRRFNGTQEEFEDCLRKSTTLYVGNLSFYTTEEQIFEVLPSSSHPVKRKKPHQPRLDELQTDPADDVQAEGFPLACMWQNWSGTYHNGH